MPKLTIRRRSAKAPIHIRVIVFDRSNTKEPIEAVALFDTGNDHTVISKALADRIGVARTGSVSVHGVTGGSLAQTARITIGIEFDGGDRRTVENHEVAVLDGVSDQMLMGRDFLERFDVTISRNGTFTLSC